jgi:alpha-D-ribose 1-methylphosphonate 5-triphosphate synthase subunit PhnH
MLMLGKEHPEVSEELRAATASAMLTLMSTENFVFLQRTLGYDAMTVHRSIVMAINAMRRGLSGGTDTAST